LLFPVTYASASDFAVFAFLSVIPEGNLLLAGRRTHLPERML
jgi:hypothetical protein